MSNQDGFRWAVVDLFIALCIGLLAWAWMHAAIPEKKHSAVAVGTVTLQMTWDLKDNDDVDLWVQAPGDKPIGYSSMHALHCDLVRDDLGKSGDPESRNIEIVYCRGAPPGEWIVNAHLFTNWDHKVPVHVHLEVTSSDDGSTPIVETDGELTQEGQEITLARFTLDKNEHLVAGSINQLFKPLRSAEK